MRLCHRPSAASARLLVAFSIVGGLAFARPARAGGSRPGSVGVVVQGPHAAEMATALEDEMTGPTTVMKPRALGSVVPRDGLHAAASSPARSTELIARVQAAERLSHLDLAVLVDVAVTPRSTVVHVWKIDARTSGALVDRDLIFPLSADVSDLTYGVLTISSDPAPSPASPVRAPAAREAATAPSASPSWRAETMAPPADKVASPAPPPASRRADALVVPSVGVGVGLRRFAYTQALTPALGSYSGAAPVATVGAEVYPFASSGVAVLRDLGAVGSYTRAFALSSASADGGARDGTTWQSFDIGGTERMSLGRAILASVSVGYGGDDFSFDHAVTGAMPSTAYRFVRLGGELRGTVARSFSVFGGGSYLSMLATGSSSSLFPRESVAGVEGHAGASYTFARNLEASLAASYTRVFFSFNPAPDDAHVAGGAADQQARVYASLAYIL